MSALVLTALHSGMPQMNALAMTGPDGQMFGSCFNSRVNRNTDMVRTVHSVFKGRAMNQCRLSQAVPKSSTLTLGYFRPL